jgi:hypothetical protein
MAVPTFYCINLPSSTDRRDRMSQRFSLIDAKYEFVNAYSYDAEIVDF